MSGQREARDLRLRRPDRCAICRLKLPAGTKATWHPARRVVTCLSVRGVLIAGTRAVAKLARRPGPLTGKEISTLYERLGATLPAA